MVISTPTISEMIAIIGILRDRVRFAPMWAPMRSIDSSAPRENNPKPTVRRQVPTTKAIKMSFGKGHIENDRRRIISAMGMTDAQASFIFSIIVSSRLVLMCPPVPQITSL
jgi:hypothetical protein